MPPEADFLLRLIETQDPQDFSYLQQGNERQRAAFQALLSLRISERLAQYSPVLTGTVPLGLDLPGSDLDVLCEVHSQTVFFDQVRSIYGDESGYEEKQTRRDGHAVALVRFSRGGFPVEFFGQPLPVTLQRAYRHMLIEARLLRLGGPNAQQAIRSLRGQGMKTEPAFARYFQLPGDPYETLLALQQLSDAELVHAVPRSIGDRMRPSSEVG